MTAGGVDVDVLIVGAGVAGLGLACALARHDVSVMLLEKRSAPGGIHRGDSLLPKTVRILDSWGLLGAFLGARAQKLGRIELHHFRKGKLLEHPIADPSEPYPYLVLPHARIEDLLSEEAVKRGAELVREASVLDLIVADSGRVEGVRYRASSARKEVRARLVVGCDGFRSTVRRSLGVPMDAEPYDHAYLGLEADRPAGYENALRVHLHPAGGVLLMPRPDRVGVGVLVEAGSARHWMQRSDADLARDLCARAPILEGMKLHRDGAHVYALQQAHAARYQAQGAVWIGDAAHSTNPTSGQGMAMALSDASALVDAVGPALESGQRDLAPLLERFEATQRPINERIVVQSHRLARLYALRGSRWDAVKSWTIAALGSSVGEVALQGLFRTFLKSPAAAAADEMPLAGPVPS